MAVEVSSMTERALRRDPSERLVPQCQGCVEADTDDGRRYSYCNRSSDPAFQWRDGRTCWIRANHERDAAFPERGLRGGEPQNRQMGRRVG